MFGSICYCLQDICELKLSNVHGNFSIVGFLQTGLGHTNNK